MLTVKKKKNFKHDGNGGRVEPMKTRDRCAGRNLQTTRCPSGTVHIVSDSKLISTAVYGLRIALLGSTSKMED